MNLILRSLLLSSLLIALAAAAPVDVLESGFRSPPDSAKPQTWWHWMNGNISKEGITADLEAMKQIGLGGATIVNVDSGIPRGAVSFMSPAWREDFKFAMQEANRLGLDMTVENCAGWSSSGGPWNTPEHAMQKVTSSELRVTGPQAFRGEMPQPPVNLGFYRDIAVLAFPAPTADEPAMSAAAPVVSVSDGQAGQEVADGNDRTFVTLPTPAPGRPQFVQFEFARPYAARSVKIISAQGGPDWNGAVQVSDNGKDYRVVKAFTLGRRGSNTRIVSLGSKPVSASYWRVAFTGVGSRVQTRTIAVAELELSPKLSMDDFEAKAGISGAEVLSSRGDLEFVAGSVPRHDLVDLTDKISSDGKLTWDVPAGNWVVLRIGYTPTGVKNHPSPTEGTGLECDKMSKVALDAHWDGFMQKVLDDLGPLAGKTLTTSLIDSYEVGGQNWTKDFRAEFQKRRGYDLLTYLPAFTGRVVDNTETTERFLWDVRRTIADLFAENYYGHFAELCRQHGLANAVEPYTGPFEAMQSGAPADVVMGEFWTGSSGHASIKLAASIAHIYGKTIVGAESFTARPETGKWQNDPYSLKALGDLMFCQGLNRYIFHRYAMQPWTNRWPGMTMGQWGFHFERTETWWQQGKPWIDYISRCEFLLQQGRAVTDAAYFTGESAPVELRSGKPTLPAGYDFDGVNADVLLHGATVKNGRLTLASGANYAALILPPADSDLTPPVLQRIAELVRDGATVIGPRPQRSPSLAGFPACDVQVKQVADAAWGNCDGTTVQEHAYGKGRIVWGKDLGEVFAAQKLAPDFEFRGESGDANLAYCHRAVGDTDIYFVSNQRDAATVAEATFRVRGKVPELWHADTGVMEPAPIWRAAGDRTTVRLAFHPVESVFVVFRPAAVREHVIAATPHFSTAMSPNSPPNLTDWDASIVRDGKPTVRAWAAGTLDLQTSAGKTMHAESAGGPAPAEITGAWTVSFPPNWGAPASISLEKLVSWTDYPDDGVRYFSGTATYARDLDIPAERLQAGRELWLDLGRVKNFAEVTLNGRDLGVLWKPPFRVNVTSAAKPGTNRLEIRITNLWPNRLIGDEQLPSDRTWNGMQLAAWPQWVLDGKPSPTGRFTFTTWHHWTKDSRLLESGLIGPVMLRSAEIVPAK
jgi:hypothetical protein